MQSSLNELVHHSRYNFLDVLTHLEQFLTHLPMQDSGIDDLIFSPHFSALILF